MISLGDHVALRLDDPDPGLRTNGFFYDGVDWRDTLHDQDYAGSGWHHLVYTYDDAANEQRLTID